MNIRFSVGYITNPSQYRLRQSGILSFPELTTWLALPTSWSGIFAYTHLEILIQYQNIIRSEMKSFRQ